jgi:hypothetical protein
MLNAANEWKVKVRLSGRTSIAVLHFNGQYRRPPIKDLSYGELMFT